MSHDDGKTLEGVICSCDQHLVRNVPSWWLGHFCSRCNEQSKKRPSSNWQRHAAAIKAKHRSIFEWMWRRTSISDTKPARNKKHSCCMSADNVWQSSNQQSDVDWVVVSRLFESELLFQGYLNRPILVASIVQACFSWVVFVSLLFAFDVAIVVAVVSVLPFSAQFISPSTNSIIHSNWCFDDNIVVVGGAQVVTCPCHGSPLSWVVVIFSDQSSKNDATVTSTCTTYNIKLDDDGTAVSCARQTIIV